MPLYLTRFSYTPATWAKLIEHPEDRRNAATQYIEAVGGKLHGFWYAFGEYDAYTLYEAPDNVAMAANSIAIGAGGALSSLGAAVGRGDPGRPRTRQGDHLPVARFRDWIALTSREHASPDDPPPTAPTPSSASANPSCSRPESGDYHRDDFHVDGH